MLLNRKCLCKISNLMCIGYRCPKRSKPRLVYKLDPLLCFGITIRTQFTPRTEEGTRVITLVIILLVSDSVVSKFNFVREMVWTGQGLEDTSGLTIIRGRERRNRITCYHCMCYYSQEVVKYFCSKKVGLRRLGYVTECLTKI